MGLTEEQEAAYSMIKPEGFMVLEGKAGTGKTTVSAKWVSDNSRKYRICVCAPTNKAVGVIRNKVGPIDVSFMTTHSLLGLREQITPDGKLIFTRANNAVSKVDQFDVIVCDECSQVGSYLYSKMEAEIENCIFVGDFRQTPPVGEEISPTSMLPRITLDTIMRQAEGSGIIDMSLSGDTFSQANGVFPLNELDFTNHLLNVFSKSEAGDLNFSKLVAWRNEEVRHWNIIVRDHVLNNPDHKIVTGDRLIALRPIYNGDDLVYNNNDEFVVESVTQGSENLGNEESPLIMNYYTTKTNYIDFDGIPHVRYIRILHEQSQQVYDDTLEALRTVAKNCRKEFKSLAWREFYKFQEHYASIGYCWAITVHKSQGSTYRNCFMVARDIRRNFKFQEKQKLIYTAMTRASTNLFILN